MKRLACLAICLAAACGDDGGSPLDAKDDDAAVDAPDIDAPPAPVFSGSFSVLEAQVLNPGATSVFGQGLQLRWTFSDSSQTAAPVLEEQVGSPLGCKIWEYTPAQAAATTVGVDEGPVTITFNGGTNPQTPPAVPACIHTANGYSCPDTSTASGGGTIAPNLDAAGTALLTDPDITFSAANSTGRYVRIAGAAMAANNGVFPILGIGGANTIVYGNPGRVMETLPAAAQHVNVAMVGPIPSAPDPGFLADDSTITIAHTMGGGNHVANFSLMSAPATVGDDFTVDATTLTNLSNPPRTGADIVYTCLTNCANANAQGSLVNIETTDAPLAGLSPFAMPPPVTKKVVIRCAALGSGTVTVPAAYSAKLMSSGATRIQSSFMRGVLLSSANPPVTGVAGHAIVGFSAPAQ